MMSYYIVAKKKDEIIQMLQSKGYQKIVNDNNGVDEEYKYLVKMPMDAVSEENVDKLLNEYQKKQAELAEVRATTCQQMWLRELDALEKEYGIYRLERDEAVNGELKINIKKPKVVVKTGGIKKLGKI
jgi:hypothetical protein